jgi:hypothetical protein
VAAIHGMMKTRRAPGIRERRTAAKSALAMDRPDVALRILKAAPDPKMGEAYARRVLDAFHAGGFREARVDVRPYDFEPLRDKDVLHSMEVLCRWKAVTLEDRGLDGVWLVAPAKPDPSDGWMI